MFGAVMAGAQFGIGLFQAQKNKAMEEAAFNIRQQEGAAKIQSINYERERLQDTHREVKSGQRQSVASRGGLMGGTDLLSLTEEAKTMQLDSLNMVRAADAQQVVMENEAAMQDYQKNYTKNWLKGAGEIYKVPVKLASGEYFWGK